MDSHFSPFVPSKFFFRKYRLHATLVWKDYRPVRWGQNVFGRHPSNEMSTAYLRVCEGIPVRSIGAKICRQTQNGRVENVRRDYTGANMIGRPNVLHRTAWVHRCCLAKQRRVERLRNLVPLIDSAGLMEQQFIPSTWCNHTTQTSMHTNVSSIVLLHWGTRSLPSVTAAQRDRVAWSAYM